MGCFRQIISNFFLFLLSQKEFTVVHFFVFSLLAFPNSHPVAVGSSVLVPTVFVCFNVFFFLFLRGAPFAGRETGVFHLLLAP